MKARVASGFCAVLAAVVALVPGSPARADTRPVPPIPGTVSADLLAAPQVNGVVWAQVVSGNVVYAVGRFNKARPFGAAPGTQEVDRQNILAYDIRTGALLTTFAPRLNAQGLGVAASPDGSRIYVAGEFTQVNGVTRARVAALSAATGALVPTWNPYLNSRARALVVTHDTVYVGGAFSVANGVPKARVAAISIVRGGLRPFTANADNEVMAMTLPRGNTRLVLGGRFTTINGIAAVGLAAVRLSTGETSGMPANTIIRNSGVNAAIYSLSSDAGRVYGSGYSFGGTGNLEGTFAASANTGKLDWVNGCLGDTYSTFPVGPALYSVGHAHDCRQISFFPESTPRTFQRAMASTTTPAVDGRTNLFGPFKGQRAAEALHWLPTVEPGTYTGQTQAAWSVTATSQYVLLGGEFPKVNGIAQQGLARFAVSSLAPNKEGPRGSSTLTPTPTGVSRGVVKLSWTATWDRDNRTLQYEIVRNNVLLATVPGDSAWWSRPELTYTDETAPPGTTQSYRIRVRDAWGNVVATTAASIVVPS